MLCLTLLSATLVLPSLCGNGRVARYDAVLGMAEGNGSPPEERVCVTKLLSLEIAYT